MTSSAPPPNPAIRVCGIGTSAGGIEALQQFFTEVPTDLGLAYVVIIHLAPDSKSELPAILSRWTQMPVAQVGDHDSVKLSPDHVYVIAPDRMLAITDSTISAQPFEQPRGQRTAIDLFFRSLAATHGDGFAVILSGSGSDGALGARAVKERGGLVLVQEPSTAAHSGMPRAVIGTGVADLVLPIPELVGQLAALTRSKDRIAPLLEAEQHPYEIPLDEDRALRGVLDLLHKRTGHDFSGYKRATVLRRMSRRMQLVHEHTIADYLKVLKRDSAEAKLLFDDLLITVTTFFRDPSAWAALSAQVIGPLLDDTDQGDHIRVWSAGCATGEEAYSLAMAFDEAMRQRETHRNLMVFASDVDDSALRIAREGLYPEAIAADVSDDRLERYFRQEDSHYRVTREIRDRVVFAEHSILRDPPFSRLQVVACRNVLIYFDRDLQNQVMTVFRYACRDGAHLFLGASENADEELFVPLDRKCRIFVARPRIDGGRMVLPEMIAAPGTRSAAATGRAAETRRTPTEQHLSTLEQLAPPSVLLDERGTVLHLSPTAATYLRQSGGPPARRITELVREELREDAYTLVHRAGEGVERQVSPFVSVAFNGSSHRVALLCQRRVTSGRVELLLMFIDGGEETRPPSQAGPEPNGAPVRELREQLRLAEQRIESIRDEHYLTNEELRSANEELQSLNEEYRSTTEELETSKEELQSVNEELQTLNHELKLKLDEISLAHADLENLIAASNVATLFLNRDLRIKRYTSQLEEIFNVRTRDYDRPIGDLTHTLDYPSLESDARAVLGSGAPIERALRSREGRSYVLRVNPYRAASQSIEGVVMTFIDVSELKQAEEAVRRSEQQLERELEVMRRLHRMALGVATAPTMQDAVRQVLDAAIDVHGADVGMVQLVDANSQRLAIVAERGLDPAFVSAAASGEGGANQPWTRALRSREIIQVEDTASDGGDGADGPEGADASGYRAVQSLPLISRDTRMVGVLTVYFREAHRFTERDQQLAALLGGQAAELIDNRTQQLDASASKMAASEVRELLRRLVGAQEEERRRIARDLHDQMGQQLTALRLNLQVLDAETKGNAKLRTAVTQATQLAEDIDASVDFLTWELRPSSLDQLGVAGALPELVRGWSERFHIPAECHTSGVTTGWSMDIAIHLYRIVQEALHNVHKHADATKVTVALAVEPRAVLLTVHDNGRGFDRQASAGTGLGLISIRERALLMGAELAIDSAPGKGTTVSVSVPLDDVLRPPVR